MTHWHTDTLTHWHTDIVTHWHTDTLTYWHTDTLTYWHTDILTHWHTDTLTYWNTDILTHWHTDILTHWHTDTLTNTLLHDRRLQARACPGIAWVSYHWKNGYRNTYFVALAGWPTSNNDPVTIILINPHQKAILYVRVKVHLVGSWWQNDGVCFMTMSSHAMIKMKVSALGSVSE